MPRPPAPPPAFDRFVRVTVRGERGAILPAASGQLQIDTYGTVTCQQAASGRLTCQVPQDVPFGEWGSHLELGAADYAGQIQRYTITAAVNQDLPDVTLIRTRLFAAEEGRLAVCGDHFCTENGRVWSWRGATMFLLSCRFIRGEDITPQIRWMQQHGVNVARVFVAGVGWGGDFADCAWSFERPDFEAQLDRFFTRLADAGLRVEATVVTDDAITADVWHDILQRVYDVAAPHWNVFVEWVNEPWVGRRQAILDAIEARGIDRHGVLSAYGIMPAGVPGGDGYLPCPVLDYVTPHLPRDLAYFSRNPKDLKNIRDVLRVPVVNDEPLGIADYDKQGTAARTTNRIAVVSHFSICRLFGAGCTIHSQAGVEGRAPRADEPITEDLATAISDVWAFIPSEAPSGAYAAPHLGNFPLVWDGPDSLVTHAYAKLFSDHAWAVNPMPRDGWTPQPIDGWTIAAQLPGAEYVLKLVR